MNLMDYHRLRGDEERSWDGKRLRAEAGAAYVAEAERLLPKHFERYLPDRLVHVVRAPWFEDCVALCELYRGANEVQRSWLRARTDRKTGGMLHIFALQASVLAARQQAPDLARAALTAFAISDLIVGDIRDVLIGLSLVCHCAGLSGSDVPALFREVAALSGPSMRALYENWAGRYPNVQGIGSMGWREVDTADGVGFRL